MSICVRNNSEMDMIAISVKRKSYTNRSGFISKSLQNIYLQ